MDTTTKGRRFLGGGLSGRLVCSYLHTARSYLPRVRSFCGFLFALRTYLCERLSPPSPFSRSLRRFSFFFLFRFFFFCRPCLSRFPYHNREGRSYLGTLQMIRYDQSIFRKLPSRRGPRGISSASASRIQTSKFIFVLAERERQGCREERKREGENFADIMFTVLLFSQSIIHLPEIPEKVPKSEFP